MSTSLEDRVLELITREDLVSLTAALIAAGGENPGGTEEDTVKVLDAFCLGAGLVTDIEQVASGRPNFTAVLPGGSQPGLLFLGHSDVVPAGSGWDRPPFEPYERDGRLYGRGSTDMKGGLAAVVVALKALKEASAELPGDVTLACTVDEEDLGLGVRAYTRAHAGRQFSACIVAEPTDLDTVIGCRGDSYIEVTVHGQSAHSGRPEDGRNAINAASKIIELVHEDHRRLQEGRDALLGAGSWNVGLIRGGSGTSMVAGECTLSLDRRLMPDDDPRVILASLQERISAAGIDQDGVTVSASVSMDMPGFRTAASHRIVTSAVQALADCGVDSRIGGWTAACDGGFIARDFGVPTIVMGPGGLNDQAHQVNESVSIDELLTAARAYALLCLRHSADV